VLFLVTQIELAIEKGTCEIAQTEVETLARAVEDLKISVDRFATQIPTLEEKVKHLDNKVLYGLIDLRPRIYVWSEPPRLTMTIGLKMPS
jgi:hypothetical protein